MGRHLLQFHGYIQQRVIPAPDHLTTSWERTWKWYILQSRSKLMPAGHCACRIAVFWLSAGCCVHRLREKIALNIEVLQDLVAHFTHDLGTGVKCLVDAVSKAHEAERVLLVLGARQGLGDGLLAADLLQHVQHCLHTGQ